MANGNYPEHDDFIDFLQTVVDMEHLDGPALGITKLVIQKGEGALSLKQEHVFKRDVLDIYARDSCSRCENTIPWSEMYEAYDNGGMCGYCFHMWKKMKAE